MLNKDNTPTEVHAFLDALTHPPYNGETSVTSWGHCVSFQYFLDNILKAAFVNVGEGKVCLVYYMYVPEYTTASNYIMYSVSKPAYISSFVNNTHVIGMLLREHAPDMYSNHWVLDRDRECLVPWCEPDSEEPIGRMSWEECVKSSVSFK